jgi:radial spoke head protein 1
MKNLPYSFTLIFLIMFAIPASAQETCQVLVSGLSEGYSGSCKRGLAHGQGHAWGEDFYEGRFRAGLPDGFGKYNWANGNMYEGLWKQGKRHGKGTFRFEKEGEIVELTGNWTEDEFAGSSRIPAYTLGHVLNVERHNIRRSGDGNMILITTYEQGRINPHPQNFLFQLDSGSSIMVGQAIGYENVMFPAVIKITYNVADKLQQGLVVRARFEAVINEPGVWEIKLYN